MDVSTTGDDEVSQLSYEERASRATIISKPMASKKLAKKLTKLIKKGEKEKCGVEDFIQSLGRRSFFQLLRGRGFFSVIWTESML